SGCSWSRTDASCRSQASWAPMKRKASRRRSPARSRKRGAGRRGQCSDKPVIKQKSGGDGRIGRLGRGQKMGASRPSPERNPGPAPLTACAADYEVVRRAIGHIRENWRQQPEVDRIAEAAGVTPTELHHLFRRWAGITPKAFLQAITLDRART